MQEIDFSRFSPEMLRAIEAAARVASSFGSGAITACHLVGGMAMVDGAEACVVLGRAGYDANATMNSVAGGMAQTVPAPSGGGSGMDFDAEVADVFATVSRRELVTITTVLEELISPQRQSLKPYLVHDPSAQPMGPMGRPQSAPASPTAPPPPPPPQSRQGGSLPSSGVARDFRQDASSTGSTVKKYCINMIEMAANGRYHHAIGRDEELERVLLILARSSKNNPVLVGGPGTGKTAIVEDLALRLLEGKVPAALSQLKLYSLDFSQVKSQQDSVGIMKKILDEALADPLLVLFIDEIHMLISNCSCADNDIANLLKPAMARGQIKLLGCTTLDEYKRIEEDPAFERRFQKVTVDEPDQETAILIMKGMKKKIEEYHSVQVPDEVCEAAVKLSARYITNRKLPDKAIDLIDEAAAELRLMGQRNVLQVNDVREVVTAWTGIPVDEMSDNEAERLRNIEQELHKMVVGQDKAVKAVADAIKRSRMGFGDQGRPIGSFLFLGTTGTGKTELCKAIAKFLFNDPGQMVRIDMSEYQQEHSSHRLFGAPPGYVGYQDGGQLTEAVYRKPFSVVLFDEIEKAHPKIYETLLQVLDDGRMTDGRGKVVNFKNTIIVMTSNMGQQQILNTLCGRQATDTEVEQCTWQVLQQLRQRVAPEFINRIDNIVMFRPLSKDDIGKIAEINLRKEQRKLRERGITVDIAPEVLGFIVERGYQPEYGGRPVKRAINDHIINPLTNEMVNGTINKDLPIKVELINNKIAFSNGTTQRI